MGIVTGLLMLSAHRYVDLLPRAFYINIVVAVILIIIAIPLAILGYYSLSGLELTTIFMCGIWLLVFYRNVEQLVEQVRPDIKIEKECCHGIY